MTARARKAHAWIAGVLACAFALTAAIVTDAPAASAAAAPTAPAIAWAACGDRLECATVQVPLDWDEPDGTTIDLAVIRYLTSNRATRIGSIFANPGGPGESGVEMVRDNGALLDVWGGGRFDFVGWDPRGTNASTSVKCFTSQAAEDRFWKGMTIPMTPKASNAYATKMLALTRHCKQVSGDLLTHISTADTARDLDWLRQGVGDEQLTYIGLSYGTMLGRVYANMFPEHVRAMMLDSNVDEDAYSASAESRVTQAVSGTDGVFAQLVALCQGAGPDRCALARHPETAAARVDALFAAARRAPIPAPNADPPGELDYSDLLLSTFNPIRTPDAWPQLAADLDAAAGGDASALETAARAMRSPDGFTKATVSADIQCADAPAKQPLSAWPKLIKRFTTSGKLGGAVLGWWQWAPCAADWPRSTDSYRGPWGAKTEHPLLLVNNVYDPATPYSGAQNAEKALGNAVLLTVAGYGHPSFQLPSACTDAARTRYLVDLVTPAPGTVCADDAAPFAASPTDSAQETP